MWRWYRTKKEAAGALSTLAFNTPSNQLAIATGLVALLGTGNAEAQEHVTMLMLSLMVDPDNRLAIAKAGAVQRLVKQLKQMISLKAQELAAAALSYLTGDRLAVKSILKLNLAGPGLTETVKGLWREKPTPAIPRA